MALVTCLLDRIFRIDYLLHVFLMLNFFKIIDDRLKFVSRGTGKILDDLSLQLGILTATIAQKEKGLQLHLTQLLQLSLESSQGGFLVMLLHLGRVD